MELAAGTLDRVVAASSIPRPGGRARAAAVPVTLVGLLVVVVVLVFARPGGGSGGGDEPSADFTPVPGEPVPADDVRDEIVDAIDRLLAAPSVEIRSLGYSDGRRSEQRATVDLVGASVISQERLSDGVGLGGAALDDPIVSDVVVIGDRMWLRVLQPGQDDSTPFQVIDEPVLAAEFVAGAFTQQGRMFDALDQVQLLLRQQPFEAERLPERSSGGTRSNGVRVAFRTPDVMTFLSENELAFVGPSDVPGATVFEFWYDAGGLRELVATGLHFHDGEALETAARLSYRIVDRATIEPPTNTVVL